MKNTLVASLIVLCASMAAAEPTAVFERLFGMPRTLDAARVAEVTAAEAGTRIQRDTNGDGVIDELWYLDTAKRHNVEPLLVIVRDEDGDLAEMGRGDLDSDLYFWDHNADGTIDVVTDYQDDDGDDDVDQMGIFYDKDWKDEADDITVWWAVDVGDDNRLWFDVNGTYYQALCQWRTHFSGDELFYQFRLTADDTEWLNVFEDPFAFYDFDGDGCSEQVVRICAKGDAVENLRYSIDADDDARGERTHDYDFSVTALPPEEGLSPAPALTETYTIRGIETHPVLRWDATPEFARNAKWGKAMFIWDEINSNTDEDPDRDPHERWEGLLNHASKHGDFPQVGGPPCSEFNKRVEVAENPVSPLSLYYSEEDRRFHLLGAQYGYLDVDYNLDGQIDAAYTWEDTDADGVFDARKADVDADGAVDFEQILKRTDKEYPLEFEAIAPLYTHVLEDTLDESQYFSDAALYAVSYMQPFPDDIEAIFNYVLNALPQYHPETELGETIRKSPAGLRLYADLIRDRLYLHVRDKFSESEQWQGIELGYQMGRYALAGAHVLRLHDGQVSNPMKIGLRPLVTDKEVFEKRCTVQVHGGEGTRDNVPVHIDIAALTAQDPEFNPEACRVVDGNLWILPRVIPHQIDTWTMGDVPQLTFLADLPADGEKTYYLYYTSGIESPPQFPKLTNAVLDTPAYVAWESDAAAYRMYTGQFDFFGKHESRTIPRVDRLLYPIIDVNYHEEQAWGMDALHVNKLSGLGGITLYRGEEEIPVQSPAGEGHVAFEYRVLGSGPVRSAVEIVATNVFPDDPDAPVTLRCYSYARNDASEVQVKLAEGHTDLDIAPGLMHVSEAPHVDVDAGILADWGYHGDDIGEIGLAVAVPPSQSVGVERVEGETRLRCAPGEGAAQLRYWILGGWRRGMQYPVAPTAENWAEEAEGLAHLLAPITVEVSDARQISPPSVNAGTS